MKLFACAFGALILSAAANADSMVRFQWSPATLTTLDGVIATHDRVQQTARSFCGTRLNGTRGAGRFAQCTAAVMDEIITRVNDQRLTAYATTGKVDAALMARR